MSSITAYDVRERKKVKMVNYHVVSMKDKYGNTRYMLKGVSATHPSHKLVRFISPADAKKYGGARHVEAKAKPKAKAKRRR